MQKLIVFIVCCVAAGAAPPAIQAIDLGLLDRATGAAEIELPLKAGPKAKALNAIVDRLNQMLEVVDKMKPKPKPHMEKDFMSECVPTSPWFIFLLVLFGLSIVSVSWDSYNTVEQFLEGVEGDDGRVGVQGKDRLVKGDVPGWVASPIRCQFLRVRRSLANWQSQNAKPPPPAKILDENGVELPTNAKVRHSYVFRIIHLAAPRRLRKTVLAKRSIWQKVFLAASLSALLAYVAQDSIYRGEERLDRFLKGISTAAKSLAFLTMFLLVAYVKATVARWHRTLSTSLTITGRLHDLACLLGNDLKADPDLRVTYTFYRYLNLIHLFSYRGVTTQFQFSIDDLIHSGLLEGEHERKAIEQAKGNERDAVISWTAKLTNECLRTGRLTEAYSNETMDQLVNLRGITGALASCLAEQEPVSWAVVMMIIVHIQMAIFALGFAGTFTHTTPNPLTGVGSMHHQMCNEPNCFIASFVLVLVFSFLVEICEVLREPFGDDYDDINAEVLLHNSDKAMFHYLHGGHMDIRLTGDIRDQDQEKEN